MLSFGETIGLYHQSGETTVAQTTEFCTARFDPNGMPVLITAYNEENDLPVTLVALARSDVPLLPIVVNNYSVDRTPEFAEAMGAIVIDEAKPAKIYALETGLKFVAEELGNRRMLLTDADTIMSRRWANQMRACLERGGAVSAAAGTAISHAFGSDKTSWLASSIRSVANLGLFYQQYLRGLPAKGRGHNMGFQLEDTAGFRKLLADIDYEDITRDDTQLMNGARAQGAVAVRATHPHALVFSRGDRIPTTSAIFKAFANSRYRKIDLYRDWFERMEAYEAILNKPEA